MPAKQQIGAPRRKRRGMPGRLVFWPRLLLAWNLCGSIGKPAGGVKQVRIANLAGEYVESGHYHVYMGVLSSDGHGFLDLFDMAVDRLVESGAVSEKEAEEQKAGIRENISWVG